MIRLHTNAVVLKLASPLLREELEAVVDLKKKSRCALSDTILLLDPDEADSLIQELKDRGYTPRAEEQK